MLQSRRRYDTSGSSSEVGLAYGPRNGGPPDTDLIESAFVEDELQSLDFDNARESQALHEKEPESDFDTFDDNVRPFVDIADATDTIDYIDVLSDLDLSSDEPL